MATITEHLLYRDTILMFKCMNGQAPSHLWDKFKQRNHVHDRNTIWCIYMLRLTTPYHSKTTPYHLEGNGQVERFNQTLLAMLRTLPEERQSSWADSLNKVVHAYNCTRNDGTGFGPFFLLFGRAPRLPIDQIFGLCHQPKSASYPKYVKQWATAMKDAYEIVEKRTGNQLRTRGERIERKTTVRHPRDP